MKLCDACTNTSYTISHVAGTEEGMNEFLFSLGCYPGESVTVISRLAGNLVVNIKNSRYSIDHDLANAIAVQPPLANGQFAPGIALKVG